jgi:predicted nucleic acid-binding protein
MSEPFVDADVIVRLLTGDDPRKQERAAALFERIEHGELRARTPVTTIADVVYVLSSPRLYAVPRDQVADLLRALVRMPGFLVDSRAAVLGALDLFAETSLDFGDALIAASMALAGETIVYSYDRDFDKLPALARQEP